jgi:hypothetical protein
VAGFQLGDGGLEGGRAELLGDVGHDPLQLPAALGKVGGGHLDLVRWSSQFDEVILATGNPNDITQLLPMLDAVPAIRGRVGRAAQR